MSDGAVFNQVYFFRQWDDQWLLTAPDPTFLGERRVTRTENLLFNYFERDAALLEEELPDRLQTVLGQAAADLGISTERLVITIETEIPPGVDLQPVQETFSLRFPSPSIAGWRVDQPDRRELQLAIDVLGTLFETRMQFAPTQDDRYIIGHIGAFIWELERLFPEQIDWDAVLGFNIDRVPALSLTELWETATLDVTERDFVEVYAGFRALFSFLTETYGSQIVPDLLDNLSQTDDIDRWLWLSTGHGLDEIEPDWKAWLSEK
jgi:hypothetical protein